MKKYLIQGMLALAATLMLTGCHEEDVFSGSTLDQKVKAYEETFVEAFGMPNKNHTWGFGTVGNARTRTDVLKPDMWDDPGVDPSIEENAPDPITDEERAYIAGWFADPDNYGFTNGLDIHNFYIQHVTALPDTRNGLFHDADGSTRPYKDVSGKMDKLQVGPVANESGTVHVFDFNAEKPGSFPTLFVRDGSALQFGVHNSWGIGSDSPSGDGYYWYFRCEEITVPGSCFGEGEEDRTAWYVGICYYSIGIETKKSDGTPEKYRELGNEELEEQRCDAWILKVVPGKGETIGGGEPSKPFIEVTENVYTQETRTFKHSEGYNAEQVVEQGRVFCEDLGSSGYTDIDFNDLVFDAQIIKKWKVGKDSIHTTIWEGDKLITDTTYVTDLTTQPTYDNKILVLAAGGTLPLTIAQKEVSSLFGNSDFTYLTMINTVTDPESLVSGVSIGEANPVLLTDTHYPSINAIPIWVEFAKDAEKLNHYIMDETETGYVPRCLLVPLGTQWATERTPIDSAYAYFTDYVRNMTDCWDQAKPSAVYPDYNFSPRGLEALTQEIQKKNEFSTDSTIVIPGGLQPVTKRVYVDQVVATPDNSETKVEVTGSKSYRGDDSSNGWINSDYFAGLEEGDKIRFYGVGGQGDYAWSLKLDDMTYTASSEGIGNLVTDGYLEFYVNNPAAWTASDTKINGNYFDLTYVTIVKAGSEEQGQGSGSGEVTQINGEFDFVNSNDVSPQYDFSSAGEGSVLRIYGMYYKPNVNQNSSNTWSLNVTTGWSRDLTFSNIADPHNINNNVVEIGDQEGCIELIFTKETGTQISTQGNLKIVGTNFKMTKLTFEKK